MLPLSLQVPASVVMLAGGAIACFGGYRLFRLVLGIYGFILGALVGSSMVGSAGTWVVLGGAALGGLVGAVALVAGYFVGVALIGAGIGALIVHVLWKLFASGDPNTLLLIGAAAIGAFAAMAFQRYVIIVGTAFGGAWTMLVGAAALMSGQGARAASAVGDMWVVYPNAGGPDRLWVYVAWFVISLVGVAVQLQSGGGTRARKAKKKSR
jgi:hypothetical protein